MIFRVFSVLLLIAALLAFVRAWDFEQARAGDPAGGIGTAAGGLSKEFGDGLIRVNGHGPEWHRWEKVLAVRQVDALERENAGLKRQLRVKWQPTVSYAYRLAAVTYGVPESHLRAIGGCESHHYPFARNGQYRGVMQEGPMFERGPYGDAFSVFDPIANVMTAAHARVEDGSWRQWACARIVGLR